MIDSDVIKLPDGFNHQAFLSIDSTNKEAIRKIAKGAGSGLWITSEEQTGGRGRAGREWVSSPGNLYCSLIYNTGQELFTSSQLSFVTSVAVRETIDECLNTDDIKCKWPNDVLVVGKKICGILLETTTNELGQLLMVIGVGINIDHHPDLALYEATHINAYAENKFNPADVFYILVHKMAFWLNTWQLDGFSKIRQEWLRNSKGIGEIVTVKSGNEEFIGRFVDLDANGALKLETSQGEKLIHSGDVFFDT